MSQEANSISAVPTDDPEAGSTWVVSLSAIIILSALVIATCVFYFKFEGKEVDVKVIDPPNIWKTQLKNEQLAQLDIYQNILSLPLTAVQNRASESQSRRRWNL